MATTGQVDPITAPQTGERVDSTVLPDAMPRYVAPVGVKVAVTTLASAGVGAG